MSHLGKIDHKDPEKCEAGKKKNNMAPVAARLQELVSGKVTFVPVPRGEELENAIAAMNEGDIVLMSVDALENREQVLKHRAAILEAEFSRLNGEPTYSVDEIRKMLKEKYHNA